MPPATFIQQPLRWLTALTRFKGTHSCAPNFAFDLCADTISEVQKKELDLSHWRTVLNGSEPIQLESIKRFTASFSSCGNRAETMRAGYGLAESTLLVTDSCFGTAPVVAWCEKAALKKHVYKSARPMGSNSYPLVSSGRSAMGMKITIADENTLEELPRGQIGEILLQGASIAAGFWNNPEATEKTFSVALRNTNNDNRFLRTGDLGFMDDQGELFVTGRIKDVIIVDGSNHYPQDIEKTVAESHKSLAFNAGAAVFWRDNNQAGVAIVQEVRRTHRRSLDAQAIFKSNARNIAIQHGHILHRLVLLNPSRIPKTSSGKIQRSKCQSKLEKDNFEALFDLWVANY